MSEDQSAVIDFLAQPQSYPDRPARVERIDTHGAVIFLAGDRAYKLKRAVKLAYLDFASLEKRLAACERELQLNRMTAPELYLDVRLIKRDRQGKLNFSGEGETVDCVVEMRRFDQDRVFDRLASAGRLDHSLLETLAQSIERFHANAPQKPRSAWPDSLRKVVGTVTAALANAEFTGLGMESAIRGLRETFDRKQDLLNARRNAGFVRRCHGDLHLKNIVLVNGEPRLFDALEFDEELATVDVLYDLAFLLMDLWHRGLEREANAVLNHYYSGDFSHLACAGLGLLPLFVSLRAGVRAMVGLDGLAVSQGADRESLLEETISYARLCGSLIAPSPPRLIAIGGLSGSGKTTVARAVAHWLGPVPGALILRSDIERKSLLGANPVERLDDRSYAPTVSKAVYKQLRRKAEAVLGAGHAVIIDATFRDANERSALAAMAQNSGVPLEAVWLDADEAQAKARVEARSGDASDADATIVRQQFHESADKPSDWLVADARGGIESTVENMKPLLRP